MSASYEAPAGKGVRVPTCTHHCAACGSHFSSLVAFDAHRRGTFEPPARYCEEPADMLDTHDRPYFVALSTEGECRLARPPETGVTIWTGRAALERAREHFGEAA